MQRTEQRNRSQLSQSSNRFEVKPRRQHRNGPSEARRGQDLETCGHNERKRRELQKETG